MMSAYWIVSGAIFYFAGHEQDDDFWGITGLMTLLVSIFPFLAAFLLFYGIKMGPTYTQVFSFFLLLGSLFLMIFDGEIWPFPLWIAIAIFSLATLSLQKVRATYS
ncbi:MAG: hypothetical protein ACPHK8_03960 [Thermoplasmatota archaeon]